MDLDNTRKQVAVFNHPVASPEQRRDAVIAIVSWGTAEGWTSGQTMAAMGEFGLTRDDMLAAKEHMAAERAKEAKREC